MTLHWRSHARTAQEIGDELLNYLAGPAGESARSFQSGGAGGAFFDTYEAVSSGLQNRVQEHLRDSGFATWQQSSISHLL